MSRMFKSITRTWNVFVGCRFDCTYCNAKKAALTRFKNVDRYKDGFRPHLVESELQKTFKPGEFIFVGYMGDISFASFEEINKVFSHIKLFPKTRFLLCTKDPRYYHFWHMILPENVVLGTTIETNNDFKLSHAPLPLIRYTALRWHGFPHKMVSIEPVMDFDIETLSFWIKDIAPEIVEVGADNYHNNLPEPDPIKLKWLLSVLKDICPNVIEKDGLARLKGE